MGIYKRWPSKEFRTIAQLQQPTGQPRTQHDAIPSSKFGYSCIVAGRDADDGDLIVQVSPGLADVF